MASSRQPAPAQLVIAAFSRHPDAIAWGRALVEESFGPVLLTSPLFPFEQTRYYEPTMGPNLKKVFWVFRELVAPERLADVKRVTNQWEEELAGQHRFAEPRPLNLDPGRLSLGKFELATTKDQAHRVYLANGIYAEATLRFQNGTFVPWPWTYADYREPAVIAFFNTARNEYRVRAHALRREPG